MLPPIYVSIVAHIEENPNRVNNESLFWRNREAIVNFADMLYAEGVTLNFQSDWSLLLAAKMYDNGTPSTNGKNFLRYLKEDLGFEVDPHAHETQYNYADVAYLIEELGVPASRIAGGLIAYPPERSQTEYFRKTLTGWKYPDYAWKAEALWGGSTPGHRNEEELWISGIWKPKDNEHFLEHDENAPLPHIGGYQTSWEALENLLQKQQNGELESGKIYTKTIIVRQRDTLFPNPDFIQDFQRNIRRFSEYVDRGLIKWAGLAEVLEIWRTEYNSEPNLYSYLHGDITSATRK